MLKLRGDKVYLRALEPEDLDLLFRTENNTEFWEISGTLSPYARHILQDYLDNAHRDIYEVRQLRLCICSLEDAVVGFVDLFDFDPKNRRAGVGILICEEAKRGIGLGEEALQLISDYALGHLGLHQLYANVLVGNEQSLSLFQKQGFSVVGHKKDWIHTTSGFKDEVLLQKITNTQT